LHLQSYVLRDLLCVKRVVHHAEYINMCRFDDVISHLHVSCDMWLVSCGMGNMKCVRFHVTCVKWRVAHANVTCHMTLIVWLGQVSSVTWHVRLVNLLLEMWVMIYIFYCLHCYP